jgi:cold shock protein
MTKNIITAIIVGIISYFIVGFVQTSGLNIPDNTTDIIVLVVIVAAVFAGSVITSTSPAAGPAVKPSTNATTSTSSSSTGREDGTVKWFNVKKGYGFITRDQGEDVFVHYRNIEGNGRRAIADGQRVSFVVIDGDKGPQADEVTTI